MNSFNILEGNQHLLSILTDKHNLEHLLASGSYSSPSFTLFVLFIIPKFLK